MDITITPVTAENAEIAGRIIYDAWGETYRGLMPDDVLDGRSLERCVGRARENCGNYRLAFADGEAAGTVAVLPQAREFCTHADSGEIVALYVLKRFQRQGVGKALVKAAADALGRDKITLFVLKGNDNAAGFYKAMGFEFTGKELCENGMTDLEMIYFKRKK